MIKFTQSIAFRMGAVYLVMLILMVTGLLLFWTQFFIPSLSDAEQAKVDIFTESYGGLIERAMDPAGDVSAMDIILVEMIELSEDKLSNQPYFSKVEILLDDGRIVSHVNEDLSGDTPFQSQRLLFTSDFEPAGTLRTYYNPAFYDLIVQKTRGRFGLGIVLMVLTLMVSFGLNLVLVRPLNLLAGKLTHFDFSNPRPIEMANDSMAFEIESVHNALNLVLGRLRESLDEVQEQYRLNMESEARFDRAVKGTSDGLWELDLEKKTLWLAPRFLSLLGYEEHQFEATLEYWENLIHPDDLRNVRDTAKRHMEHDTPYDVRYRMKHQTGGWRWFQGRAAAVRDEDGKSYKLSGSIQDITQKREFEAVRERLMEKLSEKNDELEQVIYAASHDLRSPLVNIQGFSHELELAIEELRSLVINEAFPKKAAEKFEMIVEEDMVDALGYIMRSAVKMDGLLGGLLALSRLGRYPLQIKRLDMNKLVSDVVADFEFVIKETDVNVTVKELEPAQGDEVQINQAFSNLLGNALKYLDHQRAGEVEISCELRGDFMTYCIADNGLGIPIQQQRQVFDLFKRIHTNHAAGEGLGLAIVKKIMSRHGGQVWFSSTEGVGSKFFLSLPTEKDILEGQFIA